MDYQLLIGVLVGVAALLSLILVFRIPAFLALLISSIVSGLVCGLSPSELIDTIKTGMGSTLGFVATVVGLGAMFGSLLENSGGSQAIANFMLNQFGEKRASLAMVVTGFIIAIPVFFDVAFILLVPVIYALQRKTGKSLLLFGIPLLSGLAITHSFIPPTPGPVAVADTIGADLGKVIVIGFIVGVPTMIVSGLIFGKYIGHKIDIPAPEVYSNDSKDGQMPNIWTLLSIITIPIFLIVFNTFCSSGLIPVQSKTALGIIELLGHPFTALIIANLLAWYVLGLKQGKSSQELLKVTSKSFAPAGTIILLTGAGGVFKQMLVNTGAGEMLAVALQDYGLPFIVFAFLAAALVRVLQGSATVSMITAAGLVAPLLKSASVNGWELACIVIAIASGASILSHVNDSGFWLVKEYLGLTEKQTFRSWTVMTTLLSITGFAVVSCFFLIF
jgi:Gnt-I system low-affinity gluconate transporter